MMPNRERQMSICLGLRHIALRTTSIRRLLAYVAAIGLLSACRDDNPAILSVAPDRSVFVRKEFPNSFQFVQRFALGDEEGDPKKEFGMVFATAWTPRGEIIVSDPQLSKIVHYDRSGTFRRTYGHPGSGPGEFLSVDRILSNDTTIVMYDERQHRVLVFDTAGTYRSSFQPAIGPVSDMDFGPDGDLLILTVAFNGRPMIYRYSWQGEPIDSVGSGPQLPPDMPRAPQGSGGAICVAGRTVFYANAYIAEIAAYESPTYQLLWAKRYSTEPRFDRPQTAERAPALNDILAGMICDSSKIMLAHIEAETKTVHHELYDSDGTPLGRLTQSTSGTEPYAGFLAALRGDSILTFSNRPFPQVRIYELVRR